MNESCYFLSWELRNIYSVTSSAVVSYMVLVRLTLRPSELDFLIAKRTSFMDTKANAFREQARILREVY